MIKYYNAMVVFEELPKEIALAINVTNCPCKCNGCHSKYLWGDVGTVLDEDEIDGLIDKNNGISAICFMGHGTLDTLSDTIRLANHIKDKHKLKVGLYSGFDNIRNNDGMDVFDYIKEGKYDEVLGGLTSPNTNQKFYENVDGTFIDNTKTFHKSIAR